MQCRNLKNTVSGLSIIVTTAMMTVVLPVQAQVFQCQGDDGVISLSNVDSGKKCKKMKLQPKPKLPPSYTDSEKNKQQNQLDNNKSESVAQTTKPNSQEALAERKRIVLEEIGLETRRLESARSQVATVALKGQTDAERQRLLTQAKKKESLHQSNIKLLEKEYSRLK